MDQIQLANQFGARPTHFHAGRRSNFTESERTFGGHFCKPQAFSTRGTTLPEWPVQMLV